MRRLSRQSTLTLGVGLGLSGAFLWLALRQVEPQVFYRTLADLRPLPLILGGFAIALGIVFRSLRWRLLGGDTGRTQMRYTRATVLGVFANFVLPARVGELVRVVVLHKLLPTPLSKALASAFMDRLADILVLVTVATALYFLTPVRGLIGAWLAGFIFGLGLVGLAVIGTSKRHVVGRLIVQRLAAQWRSRWPNQPLAFMSSLRNALSHSAKRSLSVNVGLLMVLVLSVDYLTIAAVLRGFDLGLPLSAPLVLWVFLAAGSALPSAPGYVGVYQLASVWALSLYTVPATIAVALASVFQALVLVTSGLMAAVAAWGLRPAHFFPATAAQHETQH